MGRKKLLQSVNSSKQCHADNCVYVRNKHSFANVAVYVDDLIIAAGTVEEMMTLKVSLSRGFRMKDMGPLNYCQGLSIVQDNKSIALHLNHLFGSTG